MVLHGSLTKLFYYMNYQGQTATILDLMALVQSLTKGKETTVSHLNDLITVVMNAFHYWNLIDVVPDWYDIEDSLNSGEE